MKTAQMKNYNDYCNARINFFILRVDEKKTQNKIEFFFPASLMYINFKKKTSIMNNTKEMYNAFNYDQKINYHVNKINNEIPYVDVKEYSHNIIGLQLSMLSKLFVIENDFNDFVKKTFPELKELGWTQYWE